MDDSAAPPPPLPPPVRWSVVVPVKAFAVAKTRLLLPGTSRGEAALALALDLVEAVVAAPDVEAVWVVTDEPEAAAGAGALGARVVADEPGTGLNPALAHGARVARVAHPDAGVCALAADLPALRPADLTAVLREAGRHLRAVVADAQGTGTVLLTAAPGAALVPRFGPASHAAHRSTGAVDVTAWAGASLRQDVDTVEDLRAAAALGLGPRSARLAAHL